MTSVLDHFDRTHSLGQHHESNSGVLSQTGSMVARRGFRVVVLSLAIAAMSSIDLYLTILYITHSGMNEMNPIARAMMEYHSPTILAIWKAGTVALSLGILLLIRKQRSAEMGAWVGCLVMGWLMFHWIGFIEQSRHLDMEVIMALNEDNPNWIMIPTSANALDGSMKTIID